MLDDSVDYENITVRTIAVDFDGVIHIRRGKYNPDYCGGEVCEGAKESIEKLISKGYEIIIFTARDNLTSVNEFLSQRGFPKMEVTNRKPPAIAYIDDRGIRFTNWKDMERYFT